MNDNGINEIVELCGVTKKVKVRNKIYNISATPIGELPMLISKLKEFDEVEIDEDDIDNIVENETIDLMIDIMFMGLKDGNEGITKDDIRKNFSLSAFPTILKIMLDLNDFLSRMGEVRKPINVMSGLVEDTLVKKDSKKLLKKLKKKDLKS